MPIQPAQQQPQLPQQQQQQQQHSQPQSGPFREPAPQHTHSPRRARPRLTEQIQIIRELWLLREQARVQAAERCFLAELERLLSGRRPYGSGVGGSSALGGGDVSMSVPPPPPPYDVQIDPVVYTPAPPAPPPPLPPFFYAHAQPHRHAQQQQQAQTAFSSGTTSSTSATTSSALSAVTVLADGTVFESHPPPRSEESPVRERPNNTSLEMEATRSRQRVTNLSAEFRARLEGQGDEPDVRDLPRSRSFGDLVGRRNVSSVLDSAFRHRLESVLTRREGSAARRLRELYTGERDNDSDDDDIATMGGRGARSRAGSGGRGSNGSGNLINNNNVNNNGSNNGNEMELERLVRGSGGGDEVMLRSRGDVAALEAVVAALREEVSVLRNVVGASFDLQLDIQRSIRQEVAAAMSAPARVSLAAAAAGAAGAGPAEGCTNNGNITNSISSIHSGSGTGGAASGSGSAGAGAGASSGSSSVYHDNNDNNTMMSDVSTSVASTTTTSTTTTTTGAIPGEVSNNGMRWPAATATATNNTRVDVVKAGRCSICMEKDVDSMLYPCGHMCTCSLCGRQLLATGHSCPICRAPVRDVVRAFVVTE